MKSIVYLFIILLCFGCKEHSNLVSEKSILIDRFKASNDDYPNISVHRGGKGIFAYPENALETLNYVNDSIVAIFEIDIAQTKDGQLVLMHDKTIDRTTTGNGVVNRINYQQLKQYYLVDDYGNKTRFKVPLFSEVLQWAKLKNAILTIDIKRGVPIKQVIKAIKDSEAIDNCIIITYDLVQAEKVYEMSPQLLISVSARNLKELDRLLKSKIPKENMLAFTGTRLSDKELYKRLREENIVFILGTLGNLDKRAKARGDYLYRDWKNLGIDIIATDRPFEAYKAIN